MDTDILKGGLAMKLYDVLKTLDMYTELTVFDEDYDIEIYFYSDILEEEEDCWDTYMKELSKKLEVSSLSKDGETATVNLSKVIEMNLKSIGESELFRVNSLDDIMADIPNIFAGFVNDSWMKKFVDCIKIY